MENSLNEKIEEGVLAFWVFSLILLFLFFPDPTHQPSNEKKNEWLTALYLYIYFDFILPYLQLRETAVFTFF